MIDDLARTNQERWTALVEADIAYARPFLDLDETSARAQVDAQGILGNVTGKDVLCLASGGGQQSIAFALLGANVTVTDLTPAQLEKDRLAAAHHQVEIQIVQADMRDLSAFANASFDIVWHAYSINFVPSVQPVFAEVARVLRPGGLYRMQCANPFFCGMDERSWNGVGYTVAQIYSDREIDFGDPYWDVEDSQGMMQKVEGPREFCHTLHTLTAGLAHHGFALLGVWEEPKPTGNAEPGTWDHFLAVAPPWLTFWSRFQAELLQI